MTTPRIEEYGEWDIEVDGVKYAGKRSLTQTHQAGIDEAVEIVDTWAVESQYSMWNGDKQNPRHEMVVNVHKLREAIKALQDNNKDNETN